MKKIIYISFLTLLLLFIPQKAFAQTYQPKNIVVSKSEIVDDDFFAVGDSIEILGEIKGDVYVAGANVYVKGIIGGDLLAAGGNIIVDGKVLGDVRAAGGQITINGEINKNITLAGGSININNDTKIGGSAIAGGGNVNFSGNVGKNMKVGGGEIFLDGIFENNIIAATESLKISPETEIEGDLTYYSNQEASISQGAVVKGEIIKKEPPEQLDIKKLEPQFISAKRGIASTGRLFSLVAFFIVATIFARLFPKLSQKTVDTLTKNPWPSLGWGLLIAILAPISIIVVLITLIGAPLALIGASLYFVALYLAKYFVILFAGIWISKKASWKTSLNTNILIGLAAYGFLTFIPFLNGIVACLSTLAGLGSFYLTLKNSK